MTRPTEHEEMVMQSSQYQVGEPVEKVGGDYQFVGVVVAAFQKLSGVWRYVVEDDRSILHVYSDKCLRRRPCNNS